MIFSTPPPDGNLRKCKWRNDPAGQPDLQTVPVPGALCFIYVNHTTITDNISNRNGNSHADNNGPIVTICVIRITITDNISSKNGNSHTNNNDPIVTICVIRITITDNISNRNGNSHYDNKGPAVII